MSSEYTPPTHAITLEWPFGQAVVHSNLQVVGARESWPGWRTGGLAVGERVAIYQPAENPIEELRRSGRHVPETFWRVEKRAGLMDHRGCIIGEARIAGHAREGGGSTLLEEMEIEHGIDSKWVRSHPFFIPPDSWLLSEIKALSPVRVLDVPNVPSFLLWRLPDKTRKQLRPL